MASSSRDYKSADAVAMGLSGVCFLHCMALPALVSVAPVFGLAADEWVHRALVIAALPVSLFVLTRPSRGVNRLILTAGILTGLGLLIAGAFIEALHDHETLLTATGAVLLGSTHAFRWWRHKALAYPPEDHL